MRICFASHNENKVREINELAPPGISIIGLSELGLNEEIAETGSTLEENSRIKARYVHSKCDLAVFADDSGLEVESLDGAPGVYSARYAGEDRSTERNNQLLLTNLADKKDRSAQFRCVITLIDQKGKEKQFEGSVKGEIVSTPRGTNGFGYDPIFQPDGYSHTFAEMTAEQKNNLSHRSRAFQQLLSYLQEFK